MGQASWPKPSRKGIGVYTPTPSSVFYMPDKTKNINYDYKSYLLCIEFVQNELDPC